MSCLFCRIVSGDLQASKVYEDADVLAFNDINPQAPMHVLIIPKRHIETVNDLAEADEALVGKLVRTAASLAEQKGHAARGYRMVLNCNADAGQTVFHIHLHLLAGRPFGWPPG